MPGTASIEFEYRIADSWAGWRSDSPPWIPLRVGEALPESARGRYAQVKVELYADGGGRLTPSLSSITLRFVADPPPPPPARIVAVPKDGAIELHWTRVPVGDLAGYLVYYGDRPGEYFGTGADQGPSPIDAGNTTSLTITGVPNGRLLYFVVAAYDTAPDPNARVPQRGARPRRIASGRILTRDFGPALEDRQMSTAQLKNESTHLGRALLALQLRDFETAEHHARACLIESARIRRGAHRPRVGLPSHRQGGRSPGGLLQRSRPKPSHVEALLNAGAAYLRLGKAKDAIGALKRALAADPSNAEAFFTLGNAHRQTGNLKMAEMAYSKAIEFDPAARARLQQPRRRLPRDGRSREGGSRLLEGPPGRS